MLLSLDMSTKKTGFCVWDNCQIIKFGLIEPNIKFESDNKDKVLYARIKFLYNELKNIIEEYKITECVFEDVPVGYNQNLDVGKWLCIIHGMLIALCYRYNINFVNYHPTEWRKNCRLLISQYTCNKCGTKFLDNSADKDVICPNCKNDKKSTFSKIQQNDRYTLKERAVNEVNKLFELNLVYKNKTSKLNEDDIAEAILIGMSYLKSKKGSD